MRGLGPSDDSAYADLNETTSSSLRNGATFSINVPKSSIVSTSPAGGAEPSMVSASDAAAWKISLLRA
jgi:hypothetical protein